MDGCMRSLLIFAFANNFDTHIILLWRWFKVDAGEPNLTQRHKFLREILYKHTTWLSKHHMLHMLSEHHIYLRYRSFFLVSTIFIQIIGLFQFLLRENLIISKSQSRLSKLSHFVAQSAHILP